MNLDAYRRFIRPATFLKKFGRLARMAGTRTAYMALLLYYAYERKETPKWAKRVVLGSLGYLLMPFDALPDLTPILGYTDDVAILAAGLTTVAAYINEEVRSNARRKLATWLPTANETELQEVDDKL